MHKESIYIILPKVISLHLEVEDLALGCAGVGNQEFVQQSKDVVTDVPQFCLNLQVKGNIKERRDY